MMAAGNPNWWSIEQHQQQSPHDLLPSANLHASATTPSSSSPLATVAGTAQHHQQNNNGSSLLSLLLHNQHQYLHVGLGSSSSPSSLSSCSSSSSSSSSSSTTSSSSSSSLPFSPLLSDHQSGTGPPPDITQSWNKLLSAGLPSEEDERTPTGYIGSHNFQATGGRQFDQNTTSSWGLFGGVNHHAMISSPSTRLMVNLQDDHHYHHHLQQQQQPQNLMVKQEDLFPPQNNNSLLYGLDNNHQRLFYHQQQQSALSNLHNHHQFPPHNLSTIQAAAVSSPRSLSGSDNSNSNNNNNSLLDFSTSSVKGKSDKNTRVDHSSECSSAATASTGGVAKKARAQSSSTPPLKVRKEKLGDRITALHQIVSPFGKTDTASVLLEAIGYIRFLQSQIEVLSSPYIGTNTAAKHQHPAAHGDRNCLFPDHPGQLLNDSCLKRRAANHQDVYSYKDTGHSSPQPPKDLRSRGLCLVPVSCTQLVGGETGGDNYWGPSLGGGF